MTEGAVEQAIETAQRLLSFDALREDAHRALMRLYAEHGQRGRALRQYQLCCDILERELGVQPEAETERLYDNIREQRLERVSSDEPPAVKPAADTSTGPLKPSIAVLPFINLSGDREQSYFSDGITEDIITQLSRFPTLFVIARNSSFAQRDKAGDVTVVARELGVHYVVEGSVRKVANRVRISTQLVDGVTGQLPRLDRTVKAVHRRPPLHQSERRSGSELFQRRNYRGHHYAALPVSDLVRDRPQLVFRPTGQGRRRDRRGAGAGGALRRRGKRA